MNNLIKNKIDYIIHQGVKSNASITERDYTILLNQYFLIVFIIFQFHSLFNLLFLGLTLDSLFLFGISWVFGISCLILNRLKRNKYFISSIFILLTIIVTYYSSFCGVESGMYLFYFPLFSAIPIFFNYQKEKFFIFIIAGFILISLFGSAITDFTLIEKNKDLGNYAHVLLILNLASILFLLFVNFLFFNKKRSEYYRSMMKNKRKRIAISHLNDEVGRLKKVLNYNNNLTKENLTEIIDAIKLNDVLFIQKFEVFFPDFFSTINNLSSSSLSLAELKLCALLKLGFTGKEIAIYTNSSMKSVDGKKYRIRKKLNLSKNDDSVKWFSNL